jgi:hypothetical protein
VLGNWIASFKDGVSHDSLVGITIGAAVGVVETGGFTQRPWDDPDGDPITTEAVVDVDNWLGNLSDEFRTDGVLDGSLVGITIGAAVGVVDTKSVAETEGFTNRPGDDSDSDSDGEPITIGSVVELDTKGFTNGLVGSLDVLSNPTEITIGASVDVVETEGPVPSCAKLTLILPLSDASTFYLEGNLSKGERPPI